MKVNQINGPLTKSTPANSDELKIYRSKFEMVSELIDSGARLSYIAKVTGLTYAAVHQYAFAHKKSK